MSQDGLTTVTIYTLEVTALVTDRVETEWSILLSSILTVQQQQLSYL